MIFEIATKSLIQLYCFLLLMLYISSKSVSTELTFKWLPRCDSCKCHDYLGLPKVPASLVDSHSLCYVTGGGLAHVHVTAHAEEIGHASNSHDFLILKIMISLVSVQV